MFSTARTINTKQFSQIDSTYLFVKIICSTTLVHGELLHGEVIYISIYVFYRVNILLFIVWSHRFIASFQEALTSTMGTMWMSFGHFLGMGSFSNHNMCVLLGHRD